MAPLFKVGFDTLSAVGKLASYLQVLPLQTCIYIYIYIYIHIYMVQEQVQEHYDVCMIFSWKPRPGTGLDCRICARVQGVG